MQNYKDLYEYYEGTAVHDGTAEVQTAEEALAKVLKDVSDPALKAELDQAVGKIARAYEMQGFSMGYDVAAIVHRVVAV